MALYRLGDSGASEAPPAGGTASLGFVIGLLPVVLVAIAFWAVLAPPPEPRAKYRGRKH